MMGASTRKIFGNAAYLLLAQLFAMLSPALTSIVVARQMSVNDFAELSYVLALVAIATAIMTSGMSGQAIREITTRRAQSVDAASASMRSIVVLRELFALIGMVVIVTVATVSHSDRHTFFLALVAGISVLLRATDALEFWYQAHEEVKAFCLLRVFTFAVCTTARIIWVYAGATVYELMWTFVFEALTLSVVSWAYSRRSLFPVSLSGTGGSTARDLLRISWLLMLSGLFAQLSMRLGVVMLGVFSNEEEVARFAAASRLTEFAFVLPVVVTTASFPRLLQARSKYGENSTKYRNELVRSLNLSFTTGLLLCLAGVLIGPYVLPALFGESYESSVAVFQLTVVTLPFVFMGAVLSKWIIAEDLLLFSLGRNAMGLAINIVFLSLFAPSYGAMGAAFAYVWSYIFSNYASLFFSRSSRGMATAMTLAIVSPILLPISSIRRRIGRQQHAKASK